MLVSGTRSASRQTVPELRLRWWRSAAGADHG